MHLSIGVLLQFPFHEKLMKSSKLMRILRIVVMHIHVSCIFKDILEQQANKYMHAPCAAHWMAGPLSWS
jgi:hypothetical protein